MKKLGSLFLLAMLTAPASAQVYYHGTDYAGGQAVHCYTNGGAEQFRRNMVHSGGVIRNLAPKVDPALSTAAQMPKAFSYDESGYRVANKELAELIDREAKKNGLDPLIVELIIKYESNYNPQAVSATGAQGLMQLMPGTAALCGVKNAFDPAENVAGGTYYFAQQLRRFQDLGRALAAYNAGPGAVESYGGIPPFAETQSYVSRITAEYANRKKPKKTDG